MAQHTDQPHATKQPRRATRGAGWYIGAGLLLAFSAGMVMLANLPMPKGSIGPVPTPVKPAQPAPRAVSPANFIGAGACRQCHEEQFKAWTGSHHELAMQPATQATVLGDFNDTTFEYFGAKTMFFRRDGNFMVRTDGPDGAPTEYKVEYTFGVFPLQQYLVAFPGGRFQALPVAWDSRPRTDGGGQRWFHLYPNEKIDHTDQLHWTGLYQNWNMMCAECHSTDVRKGYDAASNSYATTFREINVACEACHGPGSKHASLARQPGYTADAGNGLTVSLESRWQTAWRFDPAEPRWPTRDKAAPAQVLDSCAACHARRSTLAEGGLPGAPLEDTHRLAMLAEPLYFADGQQHDEVYVWGSFLQSKMHQRGVTCMDCHDPHSLKVRSEGNALCVRCHSAELFDSPKHHFHQKDSAGARCVSCHMPTRDYMVVHARLDHSIRVPRPDLARTTGAPDACTMCHTDRKPEWAAAAMDGWYSPAWRKRPEWGTTLAAGATQGAGAVPSLFMLAKSPVAPSIVRASAAALAGANMRPEYLPEVARMLTDPDPSVRIAGLGLCERFDPATRMSVAEACLSDAVRGVRIEAARVMADVPNATLSAAQATALEKATAEYEAALRLNADWPAENANAGNLALRRGKPDDAIAAFRRALELDPRFVGGYVNLADVYRQTGNDAEGERELRKGLAILPQNADIHHALGLLLIRTGNKTEALRELERAAALAPANARYAFVYAIGLHSTGKVDDALKTLRQADLLHPSDPDILGALVSMLRERGGTGDRAEALKYARMLAEALPANQDVRKMVQELESPR